MDPDLQIREGWEGVQCQKKIFLAHQASVWAKNTWGGGCWSPGPLPWNCPCLETHFVWISIHYIVGPFLYTPFKSKWYFLLTPGISVRGSLIYRLKWSHLEIHKQLFPMLLFVFSFWWTVGWVNRFSYFKHSNSCIIRSWSLQPWCCLRQGILIFIVSLINLSLFFWWTNFSYICSGKYKGRPLGSIKVSGKLLTYPSPKLTLTLTFHLGQNDGLGEG